MLFLVSFVLCSCVLLAWHISHDFNGRDGAFTNINYFFKIYIHIFFLAAFFCVSVLKILSLDVCFCSSWLSVVIVISLLCVNVNTFTFGIIYSVWLNRVLESHCRLPDVFSSRFLKQLSEVNVHFFSLYSIHMSSVNCGV